MCECGERGNLLNWCWCILELSYPYKNLLLVKEYLLGMNAVLCLKYEGCSIITEYVNKIQISDLNLQKRSVESENHLPIWPAIHTTGAIRSRLELIAPQM